MSQKVCLNAKNDSFQMFLPQQIFILLNPKLFVK